MQNYKEGLNDLLVNTFKTILKAEQRWLRNCMPSDLSLSEVHVIHKIDRNTKTMTELAALLDITISSLSTAIDKLVKKGYVERKRMETDRRVVAVCATPKGLEIVKLHDDFHDEMVNATVEFLNEQEIDVLTKAIENLRVFFSKTNLGD